MAWNEAKALEIEVLRIASALWGETGSAQAQTIDGMERDCVFHGEELSHYVECTTSRSLKKVQEDAKKMVKYRDAEMKKGNMVKLWIVTGQTPGADQVAEARKHTIQILSVDQFRHRLFNGAEYMRCRNNYRWGSATNPANDNADISSLRYLNSGLYQIGKPESAAASHVVTTLEGNACVTVLGDFGMGKSMLIRELFSLFARAYQKESRVVSIPVAINLRDHWGQTDPHEVLTRHATKVGFDRPDQLVRAYNAGGITLLLDGFDEIVGTPVAPHRELKRLRMDALSIVRRFANDLRGKAGLLVAGRQSFFDSDNERMEVLGMRKDDPVFELREFSAESAEKLLESFKVSAKIPTWVPRRPLFLAYLASNDLLAHVHLGGEVGAAEAWERLIEAICNREKSINDYLDAAALKNILERLSDMTRQSSSGRGPIKAADVLRAYSASTGIDESDEHIRPLLMRLPGLSSRSSDDGSREFLDESMLNALRANRLVAFITNPYEEDPQGRSWKHGISDLGLDIAANRLVDSSGARQRSTVAAKEATEKWDSPTLSADLVRLGQRLVENEERLDCNGIRVSGGVFEDLDLSDCVLNELHIDNCEIKRLVCPSLLPQGLEIRNSLVWKIEGVSKPELLPDWLVGCEVDQYDDAPTNARILSDEDLDVGHRVLLTVCRKLYLQRGAGRRENALSRGLPANYRGKVPEILEMMRTAGLAESLSLRGYTIWYPDRSRTSEVFGILNDYSASRHPLVLSAKRL